MKDYIVRATAAGGMVRALAAVTTQSARDAQSLHRLFPVASAALGRTMTAAALMSTTLKGDKHTLTIQIKGEGPLGGIVVVSDSRSNIRGYVYNPEVNLPLNDKGKLDVSGAIGPNGYLNVIKDFGLKEPYLGYVELVSGEIGEDIAYYYAFSEQVPSVVSLGVLVDVDGSILNSGGFLIQLMPGADEDTITYLENKVNSLPSITHMFSEGRSPEEVLQLILGEKDLIIADTVPCSYTCNCSRDRMERNLLSLGRKEIAEIIEDQHEAELQCHFCNKAYHFSENQLLELLE